MSAWAETPAARAIVARLKRAVVDRRLSYADVARRAGLHPRTVERCLEGETYSAETATAIAAALRIELDDSTEERLLQGLQLWPLLGSRAPWARLADLAELLGVQRPALVKRVVRAVKAGKLAPEEVRRAYDADLVPTVPPRNSCLTTSPHGVSMLSARACLYLILTAETERGEQSRHTLVDEGLERLQRNGVRR